MAGTQHPDRDGQFRYLNEQVKAFLAAGLPVVSIEAKKKELVGAFKNGGREWQPKGQPEPVNMHDFPDPRVGKLISATTTRTGLTVQAEMDAARYPTKVKVSDDELAAVQLSPHPFHGEWNYTIAPAPQHSHV